MWPWEHLVFGYLLYSGILRLVGDDPPGDRETLALALATQLPDLVDKPLGWLFAILPSGRSLGHSLLCFVALLLVVAWIERRGETAAVGAFAVGYLSHLAGDVIYPALLGKSASASFLLWPLVPVESGDVGGVGGVVAHVMGLWENYVALLTTTTGGIMLATEIAFLVAGVALWVADGTPGLPGRHALV